MKSNVYYGTVTPGEMDWCITISRKGGKPQPLWNPDFKQNPSWRAGFRTSPDGLSYGYCGGGPYQLAATILFEETGDVRLVQQCAEDFMRQIIAAFNKDKPFNLTSQQVIEWCDEYKQVTHG